MDIEQLKFYLYVIGGIILFIIVMLMGLFIGWLMDPVKKCSLLRSILKKRVRIAQIHDLTGYTVRHIIDETKSTFELANKDLVFILPKNIDDKEVVSLVGIVPVLDYFESDAVWAQMVKSNVVDRQGQDPEKAGKLVYPRKLEHASKEPISPTIAAAALNEKLAAEKVRLIGRMEKKFDRIQMYVLISVVLSALCLAGLAVIYMKLGNLETTIDLLAKWAKVS